MLFKSIIKDNNPLVGLPLRNEVKEFFFNYAADAPNSEKRYRKEILMFLITNTPEGILRNSYEDELGNVLR